MDFTKSRNDIKEDMKREILWHYGTNNIFGCNAKYYAAHKFFWLEYYEKEDLFNEIYQEVKEELDIADDETMEKVVRPSKIEYVEPVPVLSLETKELVKEKIKKYIIEEYGKNDIWGYNARVYFLSEFIGSLDISYTSRIEIFNEIYQEIKKELKISDDDIMCGSEDKNKEFIKQQMKDHIIYNYGKNNIFGYNTKFYAVHIFLSCYSDPYKKEDIFNEIYEEIRQELNIAEDGTMEITVNNREYLKQKMKEYILDNYGKDNNSWNDARGCAYHKFLCYENEEELFNEIYQELKQELNIAEDDTMEIVS
jgi:hypothetical protein